MKKSTFIVIIICQSIALIYAGYVAQGAVQIADVEIDKGNKMLKDMAILAQTNEQYANKINALESEVADLQFQLNKSKWKSDGVCSAGSSFKAYMDYRSITDRSSIQFQMVSEAIKANGLLFYRGYICVALGSYYGDVGSIYRITLDSGKTFEVIKADEKSDTHTINGCNIARNNNIVEFIVDAENLDQAAIVSGDLSTIDEFNGVIVSIERMN